MTDEEFVFRQTERERKRDGRGAFNKKCGSKSKKCSLPSDYMTKKEREALNGEVKTFIEKPFYTYDEFKALPEDLQIKHINSVLTRYECGLKNIAEAEFGMAGGTLGNYLKNRGIKKWCNIPKRGGDIYAMRKYKKRLEDDIREYRNSVEESPVAEEAPETPVEAAPERFEEKTDTSNIMNIAILLDALKGTGARLTIEVTL